MTWEDIRYEFIIAFKRDHRGIGLWNGLWMFVPAPWLLHHKVQGENGVSKRKDEKQK